MRAPSWPGGKTEFKAWTAAGCVAPGMIWSGRYTESRWTQQMYARLKEDKDCM
jgi:hypothetical protein